MTVQKKKENFTDYLLDKSFISNISDSLKSQEYLNKLINEYPEPVG